MNVVELLIGSHKTKHYQATKKEHVAIVGNKLVVTEKGFFLLGTNETIDRKSEVFRLIENCWREITVSVSESDRFKIVKLVVELSFEIKTYCNGGDTLSVISLANNAPYCLQDKRLQECEPIILTNGVYANLHNEKVIVLDNFLVLHDKTGLRIDAIEHVIEQEENAYSLYILTTKAKVVALR